MRVVRVACAVLRARVTRRYNDTSAVKVLKVDILTDIASEANAQQIVEELSEYIREGDHELGKRAVAAIGRIAAGVPQVRTRTHHLTRTHHRTQR